jgi:glycerol-3-phosphate dehydrogenase
MDRNIAQLQQQPYDIVIIGGGIYGACVAWDASLRGFSVALLDKGDFAHATSGNNHKIIHGGFRYLQHADLKRMRESIRERRILMRIAPHLVYPLPCLIPTYADLRRSKAVLQAALQLNDLIGFDRNRSLEPQKSIPRGRIMSRGECLQFCPHLDCSDFTAAALFFDAQVYSPDRLTLAFLLSAARAGSHLANYAQVTGFLSQSNRITGVQVQDLLTGRSLVVQARMVVNCSGPWIDQVLQLVDRPIQSKRHKFLKAAVLVTRPLVHEMALGLLSRPRGNEVGGHYGRRPRYLFITPWRNKSLVGTLEVPYEGDPDKVQLTEHEVQEFIDEVNAAYPAGLTRREVHFVYRGLVPVSEVYSSPDGLKAARHCRIHDHEQADGVRGLISVLGVKYTTARDVAEKTIDLVSRKLGRGRVRCRTDVTPIQGGAIDCFEAFVTLERQKQSARLAPEIMHHLLQTYGSEYQTILRYGAEDPVWREPVTNDAPVLKAEILHGVRAEMAQKLTDVLLRRTELGTAGYPGDACLKTCAAIMARELGWSKQTVSRELEEAASVFATHQV